MRWMWIDRILELEPGRRLVAVKNISMGEDHLHEHFPGMPVMPGCLVVEGMAQSAGILVGHAGGFREKVLLAKITRVELERDAAPGDTLRYSATIQSLNPQGASTQGTVELRRAGFSEFAPIGRVDLMFSHADQAMVGGLTLPRENFVFGEGFRTMLRMSGVG